MVVVVMVDIHPRLSDIIVELSAISLLVLSDVDQHQVFLILTFDL